MSEYALHMARQAQTFSRYYPADWQTTGWGWQLLDTGRQEVPPHTPYPPPGHPLAYLFDSEGFRTLDEFQIVFITGGKGSFESQSVRNTPVNAGQAIILFPGEWHRYQPDTTTGWTECWLGFQGSEAKRIMNTFFSAKEPLVTVTQVDALHRVFEQLFHWVRQPVAGVSQIAASHLPLALSLLRAGQSEEYRGAKTNAIFEAKAEMLKTLSEPLDLAALAQKLGMSYTRFRAAFKRETGRSPREFHNHIRLNRSLDLLIHRGLTISETAQSLGYSSVYYYSRAFKKQFGQSPSQWLKARQQRPRHHP